MKVAVLLAGVSLTMISATAMAQDVVSPATSGGANASTKMVSPASPSNGVDIVVTATRREELTFNVPVTISAVSGDTLQRQGGNSLASIASVVSGLSLSGASASTIVGIRGVSSSVGNPGSSQPNAIYVDGIYNSNAQIFRNQYPDIQRVEVLKGPQGTLFGRNAAGGAVRVFTNDPTFDLTGKFDVDMSYYTGAGTSASSPRINARGFISAPVVSDLVAVSIAAGYNHLKGFFHDDASGGTAGQGRDYYVRGKVLITPSDNLKIVVGGFHIANRNVKGVTAYTRPVAARFASLAPFIYPSYALATLYPGTITPIEAWHTASDKDLDPRVNTTVLKQTGFTARGDLTTGIGMLTSLTGYTKTIDNSLDSSNRKSTAACRAVFVCVSASYFTNLKEISQEFNFASDDVGIFSLVTGANYYHSKGDSAGALLNPANPPVVLFPYIATIARTNAYGVFGELTAKPVEKLSVILGLRYNHELHNDADALTGIKQKATFNSATPRATIKYDFSDHLNVYGTFSVGRTAGLTGVTNPFSPNGPFTPVKEEKLNAYEFGVKYSAPGVSANASIFYYDYKNKQEAINTLQAFILNTGPVRLYGLDADMSARLTPEFTLSINTTYIPYAKYKDFPLADPGIGKFFDATGLRLARSPKLTANATLAFASAQFDASATASYSSKIYQDIVGAIYQPHYVRLNANVGYNVSDAVRIGVFGRNLTNRKIITATQLFSTAATASYDAPQEVGFTMGMRF